MNDRFDNLPTTDLVKREIEALAEYKALEQSLKVRMRAEMPVKLGRIYKVKSNGRKIILLYAHAERRDWNVDGPYAPWELMVGGHLENPRSTTGNGFNRKGYYTRIENLEKIPGPEGEGPEWARRYVEKMKDFIR